MRLFVFVEPLRFSAFLPSPQVFSYGDIHMEALSVQGDVQVF